MATNRHLQPRNASAAAIEKAATGARAFVKADPETTADELLTRLVKALGGEIVVSNSADDRERDGGSLLIREPGDFVIRLSPYTSPLRDNFTVAHELGHYVLHYPHDDPPREPVMYNRYGSGLLETEANRFAAALLMPVEELKTARIRYKDDVYRIAGRFGVSPAAARIRMEYVRVG